MTLEFGGYELYRGEEVFGLSVVSCRDAPALFEPVEETLDEILLPVDPLRDGD